MLLSFSERKSEIRIETDPDRLRPIDADLQVPDTRKFAQHTGWAPQIPFKQTMRDLLDYWQERIAREGDKVLNDSLEQTDMSFFQGKNVLVTGGTGLIGRPLVEMLDNSGANIRIVSLDTPTEMPARTEFISADLREFANCAEAVKDIEVVFHLAGVKGSPAMASQRPASFMVPTVTFSFNMMEAARRAGIEHYLFTSSVGVYAPSDHFLEDDVWKTFPSPNDRFAGWAKRMGELQAEAYAIEYGWDKISIVRPANVYGSLRQLRPRECDGHTVADPSGTQRRNAVDSLGRRLRREGLHTCARRRARYDAHG